ncbi:glycosyltransferase [Chloroflexota bacterium]
MKILYLVGTLNLGGIERLTSDLSLALKRSGDWQPSVCCLIAPQGHFLDILQAHGVPVYECRLDQKNLFSFPIRFARLLKQLTPDLIHSHVYYSVPWQVLGARLAGVKRLVFSYHNMMPTHSTHLLARLRMILYDRLSQPYISALTAVSRGLRCHLANLLLRAENSFYVIHNPVDTERFRPAPQTREAIRREMGFKETDFLVGSVGRLVADKGHIYLLQAAKLLRSQYPDIRFILVGDGPLGATIQSKIKAHSLEDTVKLLGSSTNVERLYNGLDCFVVSSIREGGPITLLEAMACGLPVVSTPVGLAPEALADGCGILTPPADPEALAHAILEIMNNHPKAQRYAQQARTRVLQKFNLDRISQEYIQLYTQILN